MEAIYGWWVIEVSTNGTKLGLLLIFCADVFDLICHSADQFSTLMMNVGLKFGKLFMHTILVVLNEIVGKKSSFRELSEIF